MGLLQQASLVTTPNAVKASKLYSIVPTNGTGDLNVVRNTIATYVGADGLIQTALANVPRLDYTNGSCPSILVEPQRTNLCLQSDMFASTTWTKTSLTVNANTTISPRGIQDADTITTTSTFNNIAQTITVTASTTYTFSFYALRGSMADLKYSVYNFSGFSNIIAPTSYYSQTSASNWVRVSVTFTTPVGCTSINIYPIRDTGAIGTVFLWGAQLEAGSNATSYIPTTTTSVTRNADVISKTGISSLIGQTEGVIYIQTLRQAVTIGNWVCRIDDGTTSNKLGFFILSNGTLSINITRNNVSIDIMSYINFLNLTNQGNAKIALAYKNQDFALAINGTIVATSSNLGAIPSMSVFRFSELFGTSVPNGLIHSVLLFKTRLTNTELQQLTTL